MVVTFSLLISLQFSYVIRTKNIIHKQYSDAVQRSLYRTVKSIEEAEVLTYIDESFKNDTPEARKAKEAALTDEYPIVVYCEGKQYISLFQGIIQELENRKLKALYLTGEESDPAFKTQYQYVKPEYAGKGNAAFMKLNMISASVVLMTTPGLNVYQLKRSKGVKHYSHILHMASDATMYRLFGLDYFDSVLLSGDYQKADIRTLETMRNIPQKELVTVGCPYLDALQEKFANIPPEEKHNFTVLVSPSWGKSAILSRFGKDLLQPLKESGFNIIVRPHPQSKTSEKEILDSLMKQFPNSDNFQWDFEKDNILISDLCEEDNCHCENSLIVSSLKHTLHTLLFIWYLHFYSRWAQKHHSTTLAPTPAPAHAHDATSRHAGGPTREYR